MQNFRVPEMVCQLQRPLVTRVTQVTNLSRIVLLPLSPMKFIVEVLNVRGIDEVDEGIADIALVVFVDGEVEEVEGIFVVDGEFGEQGVLGILVGDVFDHDGGSTIKLNSIKVDDESLTFFRGDGSFVAHILDVEFFVVGVDHGEIAHYRFWS